MYLKREGVEDMAGMGGSEFGGQGVGRVLSCTWTRLPSRAGMGTTTVCPTGGVGTTGVVGGGPDVFMCIEGVGGGGCFADVAV